MEVTLKLFNEYEHGKPKLLSQDHLEVRDGGSLLF